MNDLISRDMALEKMADYVASGYADSAEDFELTEPNTATSMPCEDAISRQAVLDAIDVKAWEFCDYLISKNRNDEQKPVSHFADNLRECVREELPSVNPQAKTGHWEQYGNSWEDKFKCSECGKEQPKILCGEQIIGHWSDYCPNCGAKMVEPQESEKE